MGIKAIRKKLGERKRREQLYCTAEYWNSKAGENAGDAVSMWPNNSLNSYYHREQLSLLRQYLPHVDGARILDIGCGTGRISRYLAERGASVVGIDFSAKVIAIAREHSQEGNPSYRIQSVFDFENENAFDILLSWGALTVACRDREDLLNVMHRLWKSLNPGGKALLLEPIHKGFLHRVLNMDLREFCGVMTEAGFEIKEITHLHFWPMRMILAEVSWPKAVTAIGYRLGQWMMHLPGLKALGDYTAIFATARD